MRVLFVFLFLAIAALPASAQSLTITYRCRNATTFRVTFLREMARVRLQSRILTLPQVAAGSGVQYSDGRSTLYAQDREASMDIDGERVYDRCIAQIENRPNNRRSRIRALW
ncbi:MliC family protein [Pantanalinema rosaneae CENA516]|uniref:MliC family protein n=1 Tax=Pantanalinema rosaneae TaxID=1620701 RepID=UPI003D6FAA5A